MYNVVVCGMCTYIFVHMCKLCLYELFTGGASTTPRKPYVLDPSVQTGPQYGGAGGMYPGGFSAQPVPNSPAVPSYPNKPVGGMYPSADIYSPADNVNSQPPSVNPGIPPVNAQSGWNDPPVLKNSSRTQVCKHCCMSVCVLFSII
jgi:hypothetical protein